VRLGIAQRRHLGDVRAGRERPLRAGDHDGADRRVAVQLRRRGRELVHHGQVQRIERLRPVEPEVMDILFQIDLGHGGDNTSC